MPRHVPKPNELRRGQFVFRVLHNTQHVSSIERYEIGGRVVGFLPWLKKNMPNQFESFSKDSDMAEYWQREKIVPILSRATLDGDKWNQREWSEEFSKKLMQSRAFLWDMLGHDRHRSTGRVHSFYSLRAAKSYIKSLGKKLYNSRTFLKDNHLEN